MTGRFASLEIRLARIAHRLTARDRQILRDLGTLRVLTTEHLARLHFDSAVRARLRLVALFRLGVLERFRPSPQQPFHYVVGELGAALLAAERGEQPGTVGWRRDHALLLGQSQRLAHLLGVNGVAVDLRVEARRNPTARLARWWSERRCGDWCGEIVRPDARGVYEEDRHRVEFLLEYDRGTENLARIRGQVERYQRLEAERGIATWVLYVLPSAAREANVRKVLPAREVPVATAALGSRSAADAVWSPLYRSERRLRLIELAGHPRPPGALAREATGGRHPARYRIPGEHVPEHFDA